MTEGTGTGGPGTGGTGTEGTDTGGAALGGAAPGGTGTDVPEAAVRRLREGAWTSGLSVVDFASCHAMGMEPLGFVQGFSVMQWSWYMRGSFYGTWGPPNAYAGEYFEQWQCPHGFVGNDHRMWGANYQQSWVESNWSNGWTLAYRRMLEEASALGAHGVIDVVDSMHHIADTGAAEFQIRGTAVTVPGAEAPTTPFTTYLAGQRLVKLIEAGMVPVSLAASLASVQMIGYCMTCYQLSGSAGNLWAGGAAPGVGAIDQVNRAQMAARHLAREHVRAQLGSDTLHGAILEQFDHEVGEGDLVVQCMIKGTRVRQFKDFDPLPPPDAVVRLT